MLDPLKHSMDSYHTFNIQLQVYENDHDICVVQTWKVYINRTECLWDGLYPLFISFNKPQKAVSKETNSRQLKSVLFEAGIDVSLFVGHCARVTVCAQF